MERISVALCTYNGASFISEQLESILNQSMAVDEIIICDDNSTDQTTDIIEYYKLKYPKIIQYYNNSSQIGAVKNFEKAISLTTGNIVFLSDQDDIWESDKVKIMMHHFKENEDCVLLFTNANLIDEKSELLEGTLWEKWNFNSELRKNWQVNAYQIQSLIQNKNKVTGATLAFRSGLKPLVLPMNLPYNVWHDCFLALMAAKQSGLHFINEKLIKYRIHDGQQVGIGNYTNYPKFHQTSFKTYRLFLIEHFNDYLHFYDKKYESYLHNKNRLIQIIKSTVNVFQSKDSK